MKYGFLFLAFIISSMPLLAQTEVKPYPLDTCIVADSKLGSMGDPVVKVHEGQEIKFCCAGCIGMFQKDPAKYLAKLPAAAPATQPAETKVKPYPLDTCVVMGAKLGSMGDPVVHIHEGQEFKFCCAGCVGIFEKDPAKYLAKITQAAPATQPAQATVKPYPLDKCVVMNAKLGSMGEPIVYVHEGQEMKFCCAGCVGMFKKDPAKYLAMLPQSAPTTQPAKAQGKPYPLSHCIVTQKMAVNEESISLVHEGQEYKFCCKMCERRFTKNPDKYVKRLEELHAEGKADDKKEASSHDDHGHSDHHH